MQPVSFVGSGILVLFVEFLLGHFGITPEDGQVAQIIDAFVTTAGWILIVFGQLRRDDLILGFFRRF